MAEEKQLKKDEKTEKQEIKMPDPLDIDKIPNLTKEAKEKLEKIKKELEAEYNKRKGDLEKRAKDISQMQTDFEKKSLVLSDEARLKKQQEIDEEKTKYMEALKEKLQARGVRQVLLLEPDGKLNMAILNNDIQSFRQTAPEN